MKDLLAYAKANPGKVRIAHAGIGSPTHTHLAHLEMVAGVDFTDVPQGGAAPAVTAVLGNQIEGLVLNATAVDAQVKAGKMRVLATFTQKRLTDLDPNAPTFKDLGYNVMTEGSTFLVMGPKDLPREVNNILYNAFRKAQQTPAFQNFIKKNLILVDDRGVDEWTKQLQDDYKFYSTFLKQIGLKQ
jgi:tripartite-type tricarboxylate transporter receptor subunit TctC